VVALHSPTYVSAYHGYSGFMQDTSCAAGFRKSPAELVCAQSEDGIRYHTCCIPTDPASAAHEFAVVVLLVTHIWAEVAQQFRIARRVEYENLGQWFIDSLSRYTHDIWNILDTAALLTAFAAGVARASLLTGVETLSPGSTADVMLYAIVLGFLRIMTVLQVFEFSGSQILIAGYTILSLFWEWLFLPNETIHAIAWNCVCLCVCHCMCVCVCVQDRFCTWSRS
jgi:hypothetical protein